MEQPKKPPRSYKGLKQKQKAKISDYMYLETQHFFQAHETSCSITFLHHDE